MSYASVRSGTWLARIARQIAIFAVVLALIANSASAVFAQAGGTSGNINGQVLSDKGTPVANADVAIAAPSGSFRQKTDGQGRFHFLNVSTDTYTISVTAPGFSTYTQSGITVEGGGNVQLGSVRLSSQLRTIGNVTSRSQASAFQPNQTVPQYTVSGSVLEAAQGKAASANENAALLAIPGFQSDSSGNIVLQGSTTDQVHYQFDGVDFTDPGFNRSINQNFFNGISTVQAVPGAGDPSQGDSGAGVVNLVVKRGTYPGTGLLDAEALTQPYTNQVNFSYGIATKSGNISDFISEFGTAYRDQYGPFPQGNAFQVFNQGGAPEGVYGDSHEADNNFINNFVVRFGKQNNQSFQVLYYSQADTIYGDPAGKPILYENAAPDTLPLLEATSGLPANLVQSIYRPLAGQTSLTSTFNQAIANDSSELLKFEYDNQFNDSTSLNLRFFHTAAYQFSYPTITAANFDGGFTDTTQTTGGLRTGANFALTKQLDSHNLLTLSGTYEVNQPNFSAVGNFVGFTTLGPNVQDFLTPPTYGAPIGPNNQCPANYSAADPGCYLYTQLLAQGKLPAQANFPKVPPLTLSSYEVQKQYGGGLRDQISVTDKLNLDVGLRYDYINNGYGSPQNLYSQDVNTQPVPGRPAIANIANYGFVEQPHFLQPRYGLSYKLDRRDSVSLTYGRSINLSGSGELASPENSQQYGAYAGIPVNPAFIPATNPFTGQPAAVGPSNCYPNLPFPKGATATTQPSYAGTVGTNLQLGRPCANYGDLLYQAQDAFFPEITAVQPAVFDNFDFSFSHLFANGSAIKINPFARQGYKIQAITAPLVNVNGVLGFGSLVSTDLGQSTTTGVGVEYTLPDRRQGFTGFVSATYINSFTNTPAAGDNPYAQDFEPIILPQSLAAGNIYRSGYITPFSLTIGPEYKLKSGLRINPTLGFNVGYPYNDGLLTPPSTGYLGVFTNVPNTNFTDQYGATGAPQYVDPANPGTILKPNIAANRGVAQSLSNGGLLSRPQLTANLTLEYTKPGTRNTFGVQVLDLFNNGIYTKPSTNTLYQPVVDGVAGPVTGQNVNALGAGAGLEPFVPTASYPYAPYFVSPTIGAGGLNSILPLTFRVYYQLAL